MSHDSVHYQAAVDYLYGRINYEQSPTPPYADRQLKLDRMRRLLSRLGDLDAGIPIVHIAGTKGKGSASAQLAGMAKSAKYRTGVFSSPHLERVEERFCVDGQPCSAAELIHLVERIRPVVAQIDDEADAAPEAQLRLTFFEIVTALSLLHFADRQVDLAVLEVGLGGRLDATNVVMPRVCAITSISHDHTRQLGDTLAQIAAEKAGIIKPGVPLAVGAMPIEARNTILEIARERGCRTYVAGSDFRSAYRQPNLFSFWSRDENESFELADAPLQMRGRQQAENAAVAAAVALELRRQGWLISADAIRSGLAEAFLPGRIESIGNAPQTVIDVAHNVAAAEALAAHLAECHPASQRILVLATTRDKDVAGVAAALLPAFDRVIVTEHQQTSRATPAAELDKICRGIWSSLSPPRAAENVRTIRCPVEAWRTARDAASPDSLICIAGSFFLAAQLRKEVLAQVNYAPR
ncbi:bifunctional folylpolyglutamate synthase/dihydrofolate synthase [Pirellulales bacterium]|nr:bifunctional folylpolyglutamate synthase/dihydrofolate synthase [Pirellulales bacterium]